MKRTSLHFAFIVAFMMFAAHVDANEGLAPYKITAIKAMLFYNDKGTFSRDVLTSPRFSFWNTIIGEGDAEGPSTSTLVQVEVTGPSSGSIKSKVELIAIRSGKTILRRVDEIGLVGPTRRVYVPFWLYDTGCDPIKITARIVGQTTRSTLTKTIPFECGE